MTVNVSGLCKCVYVCACCTFILIIYVCVFCETRACFNFPDSNATIYVVCVLLLFFFIIVCVLCESVYVFYWKCER